MGYAYISSGFRSQNTEQNTLRHPAVPRPTRAHDDSMLFCSCSARSEQQNRKGLCRRSLSSLVHRRGACVAVCLCYRHTALICYRHTSDGDPVYHTSSLLSSPFHDAVILRSHEFSGALLQPLRQNEKRAPAHARGEQHGAEGERRTKHDSGRTTTRI